MTGSFAGSSEWIELEVANRSRRLALDVRFPAPRPPKNVQLAKGRSDDAMRVRPVDESAISTQVGRKRVRIEISRPKHREKLRLTWDW